MQAADKIRAQSGVYVQPADKAVFMSVCNAVGYDYAEIELVRCAYLNDPESGKIAYRALWEEMRPDRFAIMAAGINERIRAVLATRQREAA